MVVGTAAKSSTLHRNSQQSGAFSLSYYAVRSMLQIVKLHPLSKYLRSQNILQAMAILLLLSACGRAHLASTSQPSPEVNRTGNGGSDAIMFAAVQSYGSQHPLSLLPTTKVPMKNIAVIEDETLRMSTCRNYYKSVNKALDRLVSHFSVYLYPNDDYHYILQTYGMLGVPGENVEKDQFRIAVKSLGMVNNEFFLQRLCSSKYFKIANITDESGAVLGGANFPSTLELYINPNEMARMKVSSPFCDGIQDETKMSSCLEAVNASFVLHEQIALIYDNLEAKGQYSVSWFFMSLFSSSYKLTSTF